jgi:hypothetical protein
MYGNDNPLAFTDPSGARSGASGGSGPVLAIVEPINVYDDSKKDGGVLSDLGNLQHNDRDNYNWCRAILTGSLSRSSLCRAYTRATYEAVKHQRDGGSEGKNTNALRHCVWCGIMTAMVGADGAFPFLLRHENQGQNGEDHGPHAPNVHPWRDRNKQYLVKDEFAESAIDWNNNWVGVQVGHTSNSFNYVGSMVDTVVKKCKAGLTNGLLDLRSMEG